jgi:hypothetical protein
MKCEAATEIHAFAKNHAEKIEKDLNNSVWQGRDVYRISLENLHCDVTEDIDFIGRLVSQKLNRSFANSNKHFRAIYIGDVEKEKELSNRLVEVLEMKGFLEGDAFYEKYSPTTLLMDDKNLTIRIESGEPNISFQENISEKIEQLNNQIADERSESMMNICMVVIGIAVFGLGAIASAYPPK